MFFLWAILVVIREFFCALLTTFFTYTASCWYSLASFLKLIAFFLAAFLVLICFLVSVSAAWQSLLSCSLVSLAYSLALLMAYLAALSSLTASNIKTNLVEITVHFCFFLAFFSLVYYWSLLFSACIIFKPSFRDYKYYISFKTTPFITFYVVSG